MRREGFILIYTLWFVMILSALSMAFMTQNTYRNKSVLAIKETANMEFLLRSSNSIARYLYLLNSNKSQQSDAPSLYLRHNPYVLEIDGLKCSVTMNGNTGFFDVNAIEYSRFVSLTRSFIDHEFQTKLYNRIRDWIDQDKAKRLYGYEAEDYKTEGIYCKNTSMQNVSEIMYIHEMPEELIWGHENLVGFMDIFSVGGASDKININFCSPRALLLLEGVSKESIDDFLEQRGKEPFTSMASAADVLHVRGSDFRQAFGLTEPTAMVVSSSLMSGDAVSSYEVSRTYSLATN